MITNNIFSCYIIGNDNITLQCAEIVLGNGHKLFGLISSSEKIKNWCTSNTVHYFHDISQFREKAKLEPFDFLFSIVNERLLSEEILTLPRYFCINYHDSPLPKYAGLYSTSHAILNNENQHAISWHIMEKSFDSGDILQQPFFQIDNSDTALSLNLKCYEQALYTFRNLINQLATNSTKPTNQNLNNRSYFGLKDKPPNLGFILWNQPAENINRLCRALTFGHYINQLGSAKISLGNDFFIPTNYKLLTTSSNKEPGTIINVSEEIIQIATQTFDIAISGIINPNGITQSITDLCKTYQLEKDTKLPEIENKFLEKLSKHPALNPKIEKFWIDQFSNCVDEEPAFLAKLEKKFRTKKAPKITSIPIKYINKIKENHPKHSIEDILLTSALIYFFRLNNYQNISILLNTPESENDVSDFDLFLSKHFPLTTNFHNNLTFLDALELIVTIKAYLIKKHTFTLDVFTRYPQLNNIPNIIDISINITNTKTNRCIDKKLNLNIAQDGRWFVFTHNTNYETHTKSNAYLKNIHKNFLSLLEDIALNHNKRIFEFPIIDKREKYLLLSKWNNTKHSYNYKQLLHQYFEAQCKKSPKNIAIIFENESINYKELNQKSNKLAHYLHNQGIKSNDLVGICLERGIEMVICILGILKAGGAYIPLDPNYPENRIAYMLNDSKAQYLLVSSFSKPQISCYLGKLIDINHIVELEGLSKRNIRPLNKHTDLAYAIYTSGTTGNPKGVGVSHQAICNQMTWIQNKYQFKRNDIFLQKTPFSFDASIWEFFAPLLIGAKLIIAPQDAHSHPYQLINLIKKNLVSILQVVPTMLHELIHTHELRSCSSLKQVFSGGEALLPEIVKAFFKQNSFMQLHNLYGPTETTIQVLSTTCTERDVKNNVCLIGKPINNTCVYVLDSKMQLVPIGIPGELYVSGDGLAKGYLHNPVATKQKFLPNPFSNNIKDRLYQTGDLVKWQTDGNIEYLGRIDNQIKIRGFRIEINEIETNLLKIHAVDQCVVVAEPNLNDSISLSAYLALGKNTQLSAKDIRMFLKKHLPEYMIPNRFFIVERFLFTPSGKIDRKVLPTPITQLNSGSSVVNPTSDIEKILKNIWCSVLKTEDISIHDDFFDLGGNSLLGMRIISSIQDQLSVILSIRKLFEYTTIHTLSMEIEQISHQLIESTHDLIENCVVPLKPSGNKTPLFLIHPIGGSVFWYKLFEKYLDDEQPLYAIQDPGLDKNEFLFDNLETMATYYVKAIQTIQSKGPYLIGGASFGTTVAIEMARQLQEKNEKVPAVISLDGWAFYPTLQSDEKFFQDVMREQNFRILKKYTENNISNSEFLLELQSHRENLLIKYQLPIIQSELVLFKAEKLNGIFQYNAPLNWWEDCFKESIEFHLVPGDHETMFYEPHIRVLANKLNDSLNKKHAIMRDITR